MIGYYFRGMQFNVSVAQLELECHPPKVEVAGSSPVRDTTLDFGASKAARDIARFRFFL